MTRPPTKSQKAASFLVYFASFGVLNRFGFFQNFHELTFLSSYPPSEIAVIGTPQIALMSFSGSISGALFDTYGLEVRTARILL